MPFHFSLWAGWCIWVHNHRLRHHTEAVAEEQIQTHAGVGLVGLQAPNPWSSDNRPTCGETLSEYSHIVSQSYTLLQVVVRWLQSQCVSTLNTTLSGYRVATVAVDGLAQMDLCLTGLSAQLVKLGCHPA